MTVKTWFGGRANFNRGNAWSPIGAPKLGDTAIVDTGTVRLQDQFLTGVTFQLGGTSPDTAPVLALHNVVVDSDIGFTFVYGGSFYADVKVSGIVLSEGNIGFGSNRTFDDLKIDIDRNSAFVNTGNISLTGGGASLEINAPEHRGLFVNTGAVEITFAEVNINAPVVGNGQFELKDLGNGLNPGLTFAEDVGPGAMVDFIRSGLGATILTIDEPQEFLGGINDFALSGTLGRLEFGRIGSLKYNEIDLPKTVATSETFANNKLHLFDMGKLVANLNIIGDFTSANFELIAKNGGTAIGYVPNPTSSATAALAFPSAESVAIPVLHG